MTSSHEWRIEDDCGNNMTANLYRAKDDTKLGQLSWDVFHLPHFRTFGSVCLDEGDLRAIVKQIDSVYGGM